MKYNVRAISHLRIDTSTMNPTPRSATSSPATSSLANLFAPQQNAQGLSQSPFVVAAFLRDYETGKRTFTQASWVDGRMKISAPNLEGADLQNAYLTELSIQAASFLRANLNRADLSRSDLQRCNFEWASLWESVLYGCDFRGCNLTGAFLMGADLSKCNFQGANLSRANLTGATLANANFDGAILDQTIWNDGSIVG